MPDHPNPPGLAALAAGFGRIPLERQDTMLNLASQGLSEDTLRRDFRTSKEFRRRIRAAIRTASNSLTMASIDTNATNRNNGCRCAGQRCACGENLTCPFLCRETFQDLGSLRTHIRSAHCPYRCTSCAESHGTQEEAMDHHRRAHHRHRRCYSASVCLNLNAWEDKHHRYAFGCGICGKLYVRNSTAYVTHVIDHYRQRQTAWQPTLHIRALLLEPSMAGLWRRLVNGIFDASTPNAESLLRWDHDACDKFDIYLQRNAAPQLLQEQLPLLLAAGLKYVENVASSNPDQAGRQTSGDAHLGTSRSRQHNPGAVPIPGTTVPAGRAPDRFAALAGQG